MKTRAPTSTPVPPPSGSASGVARPAETTATRESAKTKEPAGAAVFERDAGTTTTAGLGAGAEHTVGSVAMRLAALSSVDVSSLSPEELADTQAALVALQQQLAAAIAANEPRAAKAASSAPVTSSQRGQKIDALFDAGRFAELVPVLAARARELGATPIVELSHEALLANMASLHVLQHQLIGTLNGLSRAEHPTEKDAALTLLRDVGALQSATFQAAVDRGDVRQPDKAVKPWVVFKDTMKKPGHHTREARLAYFQQRAAKFLDAGGSLADIKPVTAEVLAGYPSGRLLEFVVDAFDTVRLTDAEKEPTPGHTLLAMGNDALSAGTLRLFKNDAGEIESAVIGTFSGHFRAPAHTLAHMARHLVAAGVAPEKIVLQGGEAGSARAMEVLQRTMGLSGADIQRQQAELDDVAARYTSDPRDPGALDVDGSTAQDNDGKDIVSKGARPNAKGFELGAVLLTLQQTSSRALQDGALLESTDEASKLSAALDEALRTAELAGNPRAFQEARALLAFFTGADAPPMDAAAKKVLGELSARWAKHDFGSGAADPANVFSPPPPDGRRTRIVATLDPGVSDVQLRDMIRAGLDVARFNSAHASPEELEVVMAKVRTEAQKLGREVRIQLDISGPKIRLGKFENPQNLEYNDIWLKQGDVVELSNADALGTPTRLPIDLDSLGQDVKPGDRLFMNDGLVELRVKAVGKDDAGNTLASAEVVQGGKVWDRKGINMPDSDLSLPTITDDDIAYLDVLADDLDLLAVSFARKPEDILRAREVLRERGVDIPIIAKIERPEALQNLEAIAAVSDALMVARGDLGVEIGRENVPPAERRINELGNRLGKPTMVATEVLMSMAKGDARATRGDIEALYSAVYEQGADAVMLGKETSFPEHPGVVVREAALGIGRAEADLDDKPFQDLQQADA